MSCSDVHKLSALEIRECIRKRDASAREVVEAFCNRIECFDSRINAFSDFDREWAIEQAIVVDERLHGGETLPFGGVPFVVKDNLWLEGRTSTYGSKLFSKFIAPRDSWSVQRLRKLGGVPLGITNCSELACKGITATLLHGETKNPWDLNRTPGGSSGGAVAAVASGFAPIGLVTDAGGSTRRPAALTGLVGMKPTLGRVPDPWGFDDPNASISSIGQIGHNVEDVAWLLESVSTWLSTYPPSSPIFKNNGLLSELKQPMRWGRIAWSDDLGCGYKIDSDVRNILLSAIDKLSGAGINVEEDSPAWGLAIGEYPLLEIQRAELAELYGAIWRASPEMFDPDIGDEIEKGFQTTGVRIIALNRLREHLSRILAEFFTTYDLLLCPVVPVEAWSLGSTGPKMIGGEPATPRGHAAFTPIFNYTGVPAISIPCGFGENGLPIGVQIVGPKFADLRVLQLAWQCEKIFDIKMESPIMRAHIDSV